VRKRFWIFRQGKQGAFDTAGNLVDLVLGAVAVPKGKHATPSW
jgi:hypothetical protein